MPKERALIIGALLFVVITACGPARPSVPSPRMLSLPPGKWTAKLTQSGGFVGVRLTVEISSDGQLVAADQRSGRSASQTLLPATMAELRRLITETPIPRTGTPAPSYLDCFIYEFELSSEAGTTQIHADDTTIGNSGAEALILFLSSLRDAALQAQP